MLVWVSGCLITPSMWVYGKFYDKIIIEKGRKLMDHMKPETPHLHTYTECAHKCNALAFCHSIGWKRLFIHRLQDCRISSNTLRDGYICRTPNVVMMFSSRNVVKNVYANEALNPLFNYKQKRLYFCMIQCFYWLPIF